MFPEWQHRFRANKLMHRESWQTRRQRIGVDAGLHYLQGNTLPYFSVTGWMGQNEERAHSFGCLHDKILKYWPELAPVVALHLSDSNGVPMHAEANAWYQLAGYYGGVNEQYHAGNGKRQHWNADGTFNGYRESTPEECLQSFAKYVRIDIDTARNLASSLKGHQSPWEVVRTRFKVWIETQKPRWQCEADAAIALLDSLRAKE
jgi:hypothetical protein